MRVHAQRFVALRCIGTQWSRPINGTSGPRKGVNTFAEARRDVVLLIVRLKAGDMRGVLVGVEMTVDVGACCCCSRAKMSFMAQWKQRFKTVL